MRYAIVVAAALMLSGCAGIVPWISVIAAGITLVSTTENDATQIIIERDKPAPAAQPAQAPAVKLAP